MYMIRGLNGMGMVYIQDNLRVCKIFYLIKLVKYL